MTAATNAGEERRAVPNRIGLQGMNRRVKAVLLIGTLAIAASVVTVAGLSMAFARAVDPNGLCATGFSPLASCHLRWTTTTTRRSPPIFPGPLSATAITPPPSGDTFKHDTVDVTSWSIAECPQNSIARRLVCPVSALSASEDFITRLPLPKPWLVRTEKESPFIKSLHVETPLDLAPTLAFYRDELGKRGWMEQDGATVTPDRATITFSTVRGPAQLRLIRQDNRTIADVSLRKPGADAAIDAPILPPAGQARLMPGNETDKDVVITINGQSIALPPRAGEKAAHASASRTAPDIQKIDLPPGKVIVTVKAADGAAVSRQFEVDAGETWAMLAGKDAVPLPLRLY